MLDDDEEAAVIFLSQPPLELRLALRTCIFVLP